MSENQANEIHRSRDTAMSRKNDDNWNLDTKERRVYHGLQSDLIEETSSPIIHPSHYNQGAIETIVVLKEMTTSYSGFQGFLVGNITKYLSRANHKGAKLEDLKKAQFYLTELIKEVEEQ